MSLADGFIESGNGKVKYYWKVPKDYDAKAGLLYCKQLTKNVRTLAGRLVSVEKVDGEYEGNPTYQLKITLDSANYQNVFQCGRDTFLCRDILLRLANADKLQYIAITPYISTNDIGKEFTRGSVKASCTLDTLLDESSKLKGLDKSVVPLVKEVKVGNKKVLDSEERDKFIDKLIDSLQDKIVKPVRVAELEPSTADEAPF